MIKYENQCCSCEAPGYPCMGSACPYVNVPVYYCDFCDNDTYATYDIDDNHLCEDCAMSYLQGIFDDLTLTERAEALNVDIRSLKE